MSPKLLENDVTDIKTDICIKDVTSHRNDSCKTDTDMRARLMGRVEQITWFGQMSEMNLHSKAELSEHHGLI